MGLKPATIRHFHSSGGVIFRKNGEKAAEVALIANKNKSVWTLPKGMIDKGEDPETAAIREIMEETGLTGRIVDFLGEKSYWFFLRNENAKCRKTVTYFLLEYLQGSTGDHCWEVDEARWFDVDEALLQVSFKGDREILLKARDKIWAK